MPLKVPRAAVPFARRPRSLRDIHRKGNYFVRVKNPSASAVRPKRISAGTKRVFLLMMLASLTINANAGKKESHSQGKSETAKNSRSASNSRGSHLVSQRTLPQPTPGVTDLKFGEFYEPIGDYGLEYSQKISGLNGKRVRILGYMVQQDSPTPGVLLLAPIPVKLHEAEYGLADDLPPATMHVFVSSKREKIVPFTPGLLLLTGVVSIGNRVERDGRTSTVRLTLDPLQRTQKNPAQRRRQAKL